MFSHELQTGNAYALLAGVPWGMGRCFKSVRIVNSFVHHEGTKDMVGRASRTGEFRIVSLKGRQGRKVTGQKPVIPSECEGSQKDFSLRSK